MDCCPLCIAMRVRICLHTAQLFELHNFAVFACSYLPSVQVSPHSSSSRLVCNCNHLSIFSGLYFIHPTKIDIFDFSLLLHIQTNVVTLAVVLNFWIVYVLLMVWAANRDRKDVKHVGELTFYFKIISIVNIIITSQLHPVNFISN